MLATWYQRLFQSEPIPPAPYISGSIGKKRRQIDMSGGDVSASSYTPKTVFRNDDDECLLLLMM